MTCNVSQDTSDKIVTIKSVFTSFWFISVRAVEGLNILLLNLNQIEAYDMKIISNANPIDVDITVIVIFLLKIA